MILLTLGTTDMKFERLVNAIDLAVGSGAIHDEVFAQIGCSDYIPKNMNYKRLLEKEEFDTLFKQADFIIGHAGMGTITMALNEKKPALLVPRLGKYKEHVNDHQVHTARKFEELGHIICLFDPYDQVELVKKISEAKKFIPKKRITLENEMASDIINFLQLEKL